MTRYFLSFILSICFTSAITFAFSQEADEPSKPKAEFSGFFRFDYWFDTYQNAEALDGLLLLYPLKPNLDANGEDINAASGLNALAMGTRLRANIIMPKLFNAKSAILVEVDFTGTGDITGSASMAHFRFRHGFAKLVWDSGTELNVGLTWHPMFVPEIFPHVASLNTGAPIQSFNRSPQVTLKQNIGSSVKLIVSALTQSDYKSYGPDGQSSKYLRQSFIPNLYAQIQLNINPVTAGIAVDYKSLMPRLYSTNIVSQKYVTNERINSLSGLAFLKVQSGLLTAKLKATYGQNLAEHLMLGGYGVSTLNSATGRETYTPFNHFFGQLNITYGKDYMPGVFIGYAKNLGAVDELVNIENKLFGRGLDIDYLYRITPNFTLKKDKLSVIGEVEYTFASAGENNLFDRGRVVNTKSSANTRFLVVIQYDF